MFFTNKNIVFFCQMQYYVYNTYAYIVKKVIYLLLEDQFLRTTIIIFLQQGDREKITVFGPEAGAASAGLLAVMPRTRSANKPFLN